MAAQTYVTTSRLNDTGEIHHLQTHNYPETISSVIGEPAESCSQTHVTSWDEGDVSLGFDNQPPFPDDVAVAPLLRIDLHKLLIGEQNEIDRLWKACCDLGFFYLDIRAKHDEDTQDTGCSRSEEDFEHTCTKEQSTTSDDEKAKPDLMRMLDGNQLLMDADNLFDAGKQVFSLPLEEKVKYDFKDQGSYFGYKGYGEGIIDSKGTTDRNEFYNVSKDDILGISERLPAPSVLEPCRSVLRSFICRSHSIVELILTLLNQKLELATGQLPSLHRLHVASGDQVRWVHAPPQPQDDRRTALGEHTDFGSISILFNRLGGLQVLPPHSNDWSYVKPLGGHVVINLGDAMVKFTAGVLHSNLHRVINPPGEQASHTRMSLVYFARPEDDVLLRVLEGSDIIDARRDENDAFGADQNITSKEWIRRRALGRRQGGNWQKSGGTEGGHHGR
ncbi:hypothetical protein AAFC00_000930 [Neodothiora populina]|uniref:Fe2OG dioxygenase domain-containing protein n=1 Tax=Neodothiora populina TaxID=2781224 RepID=A0ABR3PM88_9PEZI